MEFDVVIVGAGPAGLSAAIQLKQHCQHKNHDISVCVVEKGSEVGAHIISGNVFDPKALDELIPEWPSLELPIHTKATDDRFMFLSKHKAYTLPTPKHMNNRGNYIISLANVCRWLAQYAENLGVEIFAGFAATEVLFDETGNVYGIATGDMGIDKAGNKTSNYQPGVEIHAKYTLLGEGCRGSLTKTVIKRFHLDAESDHQTYALGFKEIWQISPEQHNEGTVIHSVGWPLNSKTYGGSFIYHMNEHQLAIGFVIGLDYENPYLSPFDEFQQFKTHPSIATLLEGGERISYGARAIVEGGLQSLPQPSFPGGMLIGDSAGFLNVPKIKGTHTAMKSGMIAADTIYNHLCGNATENYEDNLKNSWLWSELHSVRNIRPGFKYGLYAGLGLAAFDTYICRGKAPWTLSHGGPDYLKTEKARDSKPISYPKPDGKITFDKASSVYLSNTNHEENQPSHLKLKDKHVPTHVNWPRFKGLEERFCPAAVYEYIKTDENTVQFQINAQNCIHCKTCDIKDPSQNIQWTPPEGGGGPNYSNM